MAPLTLYLFGPLRVLILGEPLPRMRSRSVEWLLALLVLRPDRAVDRVWLAGTLWPDSEEKQALHNLRDALMHLRKALGVEGARIQSPTRDTLTLALDGAEVDVLRFDAAIKAGDEGSLQSAVALYTGPLLEGCYEAWVALERESREQRYLAALETLAARAVQNEEAPEAVRFLRQALHVDPFRETSHRGLLEALAALGDRAGLTLAYRQLRLLLHDELQTEPAAETKALYERLHERVSRQSTIATVPPGRPASAPPPPPLLRIPCPVSELVGREEETENVASLLADHRLVTLTGSGGIGKTRLALAIAARVADSFPEGVWFVDLSPLTDPAQVLPTVARALDVREQEGHRSSADALRKRLIDHLQGRRLLLVLDNAEHLLESCAPLTAALLECLPKLHALVTSRMPLGVPGEQVWRVPSLSFPDPSTPVSGPLTDSLLEYAGPRLFVTRALSASSAFVLTEKNARAIVQICARLDGIPLALELAAARIPSLSAEQISARLEDAFGLLTTGARTALPRHRTLRALVDWSYGLLSEPERVLLGRLSVFGGGWTLEAAESVCGFAPLDDVEGGAVLDLLASLVDKSLVLAVEAGGATRYRMLETLRQFGADRLGASGGKAGVRLRHRDFFLRLAEAADPKLRGPEQSHWLSVLEAEHDNLRQALEFCLEDAEDGASGEVGLRLGAALQRFWMTRGHVSEGRERLAALLSHSGGQGRTRARADALHGAGVLAFEQGDYSPARSLYEESLAIFRELGDKDGIAYCLNNLGNMARELGDYVSARSLYEESLAISRELGDKNAITASLNNLGNVARHQGDYSSARSLYEQSLALRRELGDKNGVAACLNNLGHAARALGDYASARRLYEESLAIFRELGDKSNIASSFNDLGNVAREQGDYASARSLYQASLTLRRELGDTSRVANALEAFASLAVKEERGECQERSVRLWGAAAALRDALGTPLSPLDREKRENALAAVRASLGEAAFAAAWEEGWALNAEQAESYALSE